MNKQMQTINDNIRLAAAARKAYKGKDVAYLIGMPLQTFYDRMKDPTKWRIDELFTVCDRCNVNITWLTEEHKTIM